MKKEIHPNYRKVVFKDLGSDFEMLCGSTVETQKTVEFKDGKTYPLYEIEISSGSHPFYTGNEKILDTAGRVEKFQAKMKMAQQKKEELESRVQKKEEHKKTLEEIFKPKKVVAKGKKKVEKK